jgi:hypothetical protein
LDAHLNDTTDAHDASAISVADAGNDFTATDVEGALAELQSDAEAHVAAADPHTGYQKESEKDAASGYAGLTAGTKIALAQLQEVLGIHDLTDVAITAAASGDFLRHNGTAWVDATLSDGDIPAGIARDSEVATAVSDHAGAADPHTVYQKESEKDAASGYAGLTAGTKIALAQLQEVLGIHDLSDVAITAAASGDFLRHNGTAWVDATIADADLPSTITRDSENTHTIIDSRGGTVLTPSGAINVIVWRAPYACTLTNVRGYRVGGTGATINARRNNTDNGLASALSLTNADQWMDGGAVQNTAYAAGDELEIMVVSVAGSPTQVAIQVDFTRTV